MAILSVRLEGPTGTQTHRMDVPGDVPMNQLIPAVVVRLFRDGGRTPQGAPHYPIMGRDGEPIAYRLYFRAREVGRDDTLEGAGVQNDDHVTLTFEPQAGSAP